MVKAVVLGTASGIGQPLSLLLKANSLVDELSFYDIIATPSVAADLSHISTPTKVEGCLPENDGLAKTLKGADIVVIPAGLPRKPVKNTSIVRDLATGVALSSVFGVTTLDVVRASTFVAEKRGDLTLAKEVIAPVVSGHSGATIIPLLSQASHTLPSISTEEYDALVKRIQFGGDEVVQAKQGAGSATLSMAYAGAEFATKVLRAIKGEKGIVALTYVSLAADPHGAALLTKELGEEIVYFSANVTLGTEGVIKISPLGNITPGEKELVKAALPELAKN
ncbi:NAD-malate dehydrogenase, partial [Macrolepiota fuliginosa MF-IS2]